MYEQGVSELYQEIARRVVAYLKLPCNSLNLNTENQAGIPLYMQAVSGNANDSETFKKKHSVQLSILKNPSYEFFKSNSRLA